MLAITALAGLASTVTDGDIVDTRLPAALQRGTPQSGQRLSGVSRTHQIPRRTDGAHEHKQHQDPTGPPIVNLSDESPPRGRHPERRSTGRRRRRATRSDNVPVEVAVG